MCVYNRGIWYMVYGTSVLESGLSIVKSSVDHADAYQCMLSPLPHLPVCRLSRYLMIGDQTGAVLWSSRHQVSLLQLDYANTRIMGSLGLNFKCPVWTLLHGILLILYWLRMGTLSLLPSYYRGSQRWFYSYIASVIGLWTRSESLHGGLE